MTDPKPKETVWTKVNVLAAVAAVLVALAGLLYTIHSGSAGAASAPSTPDSSSTQTSGPAVPSGTNSPSASQPPSSTQQTLPLTSLTLAAGAGNVTRNGTTLTMACGTNQSDDLFRELEYTLPATRHYPHFRASVHGSKGDADQQFTMTAFVRGQYVRANQTRQIGTVTFGSGGDADLHGDLTDDVDTLVLRLVCHLPGSSVTITAAALTS